MIVFVSLINDCYFFFRNTIYGHDILLRILRHADYFFCRLAGEPYRIMHIRPFPKRIGFFTELILQSMNSDDRFLRMNKRDRVGGNEQRVRRFPKHLKRKTDLSPESRSPDPPYFPILRKRKIDLRILERKR